MWTIRGNGETSWSEFAKILLVNQIWQHKGDRSRRRKSMAWKMIHETLVQAGMPTRMGIEDIKKSWTNMQLVARAKQTELLGKKIYQN